MVVQPREDDELHISASSQGAMVLQGTATRLTGRPQNKVIVEIKRIGGGFGGKTMDVVFAGGPAIVAADK